MNLTDKSGNYLGTIKDSSTGHQTAYDNSGNYRGKYDKTNNTTYDKNGNYLGKGNYLTNLIIEKK